MSLDNPSIALYWCLRHGQRRQIAEQFGATRDADHRLCDVVAARLWLRRLDRSGSFARAMIRARVLHQNELRRIENSIRIAGAHGWRDELEEWRDHKYHLLALSAG